MSKLPKEHQFLDFSDYGRPLARYIAEHLKNTSITPIHVTIWFIISGFIAIVCILNHNYWATAFFLILKSILDAADGELARVKNTPSYTGRYLDSVSDIILNLLILISIWHVTNGSLVYALLAFFGLQLQGTLYNYYYVILRNKYAGDTTSRIIEEGTPTAMMGETQKHVNYLFKTYTLLYGLFDRIIYRLDRNAVESEKLPNWFMTAVSTFGLGFQLLIIGFMLVVGHAQYIIPFFIGYSLLIFVFIAIRKFINS
ncbi:CDP-alcohol phosphatidyltransferase family protein [Aurantibacter crassamenti]|uniref:CDP-alcohol phosphatidyltransferase family protein n=1 Tax=Aurantibacter crassamenti TaxID=1837375 RepID=UPI001939B411|nr:CDP-alcohol phosphatidyltransferase family protein [Aurantibacter crassamenti]MBM1107631.1 CDP-alcohol phosphatidyltransferase family protein [Aurantibacter crassamenti]